MCFLLFTRRAFPFHETRPYSVPWPSLEETLHGCIIGVGNHMGAFLRFFFHPSSCIHTWFSCGLLAVAGKQLKTARTTRYADRNLRSSMGSLFRCYPPSLVLRMAVQRKRYRTTANTKPKKEASPPQNDEEIYAGTDLLMFPWICRQECPPFHAAALVSREQESLWRGMDRWTDTKDILRSSHLCSDLKSPRFFGDHK
jgi:hypothetical protein